MIAALVSLVTKPTIISVISVSESMVKAFKNALSEDIATTINRKVAKNDLETALDVLSTIEHEGNRKAAMQRVITHLERAFNSYVEIGDFNSSCVVGLYLSCAHKIVGSRSRILQKIWLKVPAKEIQFGSYTDSVRQFFSIRTYRKLVTSRKDSYLNRVNPIIDDLGKKAICALAPTSISGVLMMGGWGRLIAIKWEQAQMIKEREKQLELYNKLFS